MVKRLKESRTVEATLMQPDLHDAWENAYRTPENARFYDSAIAYVGKQLDATVRPKLLDAGCGICDYSIRLARQGFQVTAVDFSEPVLANAKTNIMSSQLADMVKLQRENLVELTFSPDAFDAIFCWGVLMHIPDIESATAELARVLRPGGRLAVCESNLYSIESMMVRGLRTVSRNSAAKVKRTPAGLEHWRKHQAGYLMTRIANINWLLTRFASLGLDLHSRSAGQFSEAFVHIPRQSMKKLVHRLNQEWFERVRWAWPARSNILVFEKRASRVDLSPSISSRFG